MLLIGCLLTKAATAAQLAVNLADFTAQPVTGRVVTLTFLGTPGLYGTNLLTRDPLRRTNDATGQVWFSNTIAGAYELGIGGTYALAYRLIVPDTNIVVSASACVTNAVSASGSAPFPTRSEVTNIVNAIGGPTSGITATQGTNIAVAVSAVTSNGVMGQLMIASNSLYAGGGGVSLSQVTNVAADLDTATSNALRTLSTGGFQANSNRITSATNLSQTAAVAVANGGFQVNSNRIGLWDDWTWGTVVTGAGSDGVERMIFYNAPGLTTDTTGIASNKLLFFNGPYLNDPGAAMPLTNCSLTSQEAEQLHGILPDIQTNGPMTNSFFALHVSQLPSAPKTFTFSNCIVFSGFGGIGTDGTYLTDIVGHTYTNLSSATWTFIPPNIFSNAVMRYTDAAGDFSLFSDQGGGLPTGTGRYDSISLSPLPANTNRPVLWRDNTAFQPANTYLTNLANGKALTNANAFQATNAALTTIQTNLAKNTLFSDNSQTWYLLTNATLGTYIAWIPGTGLVKSNTITGAATLLIGTNGGAHYGTWTVAGPKNVIVDGTNFANYIVATNTITGNFPSPVLTNLIAPGRAINFNTNATGTQFTVQQTNRVTTIATNATSATLDFDTGTTWYEVPQLLTTNLVLSPTNLAGGREIFVFFSAANGNYDVTVTNTSATAIRWAFNCATNGSTSFTVTNNAGAELSIVCRSNNILHAVYAPFR